MREFFSKNKTSVALVAVLLIFTVLLCIPTTIKVFAGVFGYAVYLYLALGYVYLFLNVKKIKLRVKKRRLALYITTFACALMTLHIGLCGAGLVNSGFGGYVGGTYENPTAGGVVFSLISLPVALPCKYIASVIIFFLLTACCGFFVIKPLVFESEKAAKARAELSKSTPVAEEKIYNEEVCPAPVTTEEEPHEINILTEEPPIGSREYARRLLFGDAPKPVRTDAKPVPVSKKEAEDLLSGDNSYARKNGLLERKKGSYNIVDGVDAILLPPDDAPYTNNYMNKVREEAKSKLFTTSLSEDYRIRYGDGEEIKEKTIGEKIGETISVNPYIPSKTIFEKEESPSLEENCEYIYPEQKPVAENFTEQQTDSDGEDYENITRPEVSDEYENELPKAVDSSFLNALRATGATPPPVTDSTLETVRTAETLASDESDISATKEERIHIGQNSVKHPLPETTLKPEPKVVIPPVKEKKPYVAPTIKMLVDHVKEGFSPYVDNYQDLKEVFEVKLKNFNIDVKLVDVVKGPTITLCILELSEKCSISKVFSIKQDISRMLKTANNADINIVPKISGSSYFGIEVPNEVKGIVSFKEVIASPEYTNAKGDLVLALGKTNDGKTVIDDLADMPHALIAGSTGSGKSVCINAILASILYRYSPDEVKLILIDLKIVEMANFGGLPHMLFKEPLNEIPEVINALKWLREETFRRFNLFKDMRVRNLNEYNAKMEKDAKMPRIVIIIDEASELMSDPTGRKTVESTLSSLARVARAAGVHMIFATQNPVKEVITNEIQNNLNTKIAFAVGDYVHSMVIFKAPGAEKLLGKGDMIIKKGSDMQRAQCAFISTEEIEKMVGFIKQNNDVDFDEDMIERILHGSKEEVPLTPADIKTSSLTEKKNFDDDENFQALVKESLRIFVETDRVSGTYIQRRFSKGYNTIANVMDYLEEKGYISPQVNNKRKLLMTKEEFYDLYPDEKPLDEI